MNPGNTAAVLAAGSLFGAGPQNHLMSHRAMNGRESFCGPFFPKTWLIGTHAESPGNEYPTMKIYVSNLPAGTSDSGLAEIFEPFGMVTAAHVMTSSGSGHSRGFGFVEMMRKSGKRAILELNGQETDGLVLRVKEAREVL